jgi:hypothetical protein
MTNAPIAELIASRLPNLVHPGDENTKPFSIPLPMFATSAAIPPEMADEFANQAGLPTADVAKVTAEAIVGLIEGEGASRIIGAAELDELRATAEVERTKHRQPQLRCRSCNAPLLRLNVDTTNPVIDGKQLIAGLSALNPDCPHGPRTT